MQGANKIICLDSNHRTDLQNFNTTTAYINGMSRLRFLYWNNDCTFNNLYYIPDAKIKQLRVTKDILKAALKELKIPLKTIWSSAIPDSTQSKVILHLTKGKQVIFLNVSLYVEMILKGYEYSLSYIEADDLIQVTKNSLTLAQQKIIEKLDCKNNEFVMLDSLFLDSINSIKDKYKMNMYKKGGTYKMYFTQDGFNEFVRQAVKETIIMELEAIGTKTRLITSCDCKHGNNLIEIEGLSDKLTKQTN